ncbi:MAG: hypothetical protein KAU84_00725 [Thermoplasmatales archaeon]|nr:hypothetical protein [Thermoplasmatales archaeon]
MRCISIIKEGRRRRYVGFDILYTKKSLIDKSEIILELRKQCRTLFDKDCRDMGIYLIRFDGEKGIVRCNHIEKDNTIKLLRSIKDIGTKKVSIETLGTSGTIKSLIKKHM